MPDLEQITKAAGAYAMNSWWQAHDEKDWDKVKDNITISESVLTRYTGKPIDSKAAGENFVEALKAYDDFTEMLKEGGHAGNDQLANSAWKILDYLKSYYTALFGPEFYTYDIAAATAGW